MKRIVILATVLLAQGALARIWLAENRGAVVALVFSAYAFLALRPSAPDTPPMAW